MITILSDEVATRVGSQLQQAFLAAGQLAEVVELKDAQVKPCVNCGGCTTRSYNKCVIRDDGDWIYPKIARADALVLVTPIVFGGFSLRMKRVLDKLGLLMDRHYHLVCGEMVKGGMPGRTFRYYPVGLREGCTGEELQAFERLVHETVVITQGKGRAMFAENEPTPQDIQAIVREVVA